MTKPENSELERARELEGLKQLQCRMLAELAVEVRLLRKYELRFQRDKNRNDRQLRDKFSGIVDDRLSDLSSLAYRIDNYQESEVAHG